MILDFDLVHSELIYTGRAFNVKKDLVRLPDGRTHYFDIVDHQPAVTMIPVDENRDICFVRQYRHAASRELIELPAGVLEPDEEPILGAYREIREEVGVSAKNLIQIGDFFLAPGYSTEKMYVFMAEDLSSDPLPRDEDEFLNVLKISVPYAYKMIQQKQIEDAKSISALLLALPYFIDKGDIRFSTSDRFFY